MTPQANKAGATAGEVAAVADGSAATPAEEATAITSHLSARCSHNTFEILFHYSRSHQNMSQYVTKSKPSML
jgi:hypothetical protein